MRLYTHAYNIASLRPSASYAGDPQQDLYDLAASLLAFHCYNRADATPGGLRHAADAARAHRLVWYIASYNDRNFAQRENLPALGELFAALESQAALAAAPQALAALRDAAQRLRARAEAPAAGPPAADYGFVVARFMGRLVAAALFSDVRPAEIAAYCRVLSEGPAAIYRHVSNLTRRVVAHAEAPPGTPWAFP